MVDFFACDTCTDALVASDLFVDHHGHLEVTCALLLTIYLTYSMVVTADIGSVDQGCRCSRVLHRLIILLQLQLLLMLHEIVMVMFTSSINDTARVHCLPGLDSSVNVDGPDLIIILLHHHQHIRCHATKAF